MTWLLAHQGGWDEILLFVGPIVVAFLVIRSLERRGKKQQDETQDSQNSVP
ncbi:MAG: hypothetical protein QNJ81_06065 [Acidimicrobiia bacterium]|nr:hypothetical protein [Acidimicrobiia bacterium]